MSDNAIETKTPEQNFKEDKFYFSYSSLVKLLRDPKLFYNDYVLRQRIDKAGKHLDIGEVFHCLVLEPENFDNKFVTLTKNVPGGKLREMLDLLYGRYVKDQIAVDESLRGTFFLQDLETEILQCLVDIDAYQSLQDAKRATNGVKLTGDEKRLEKCQTPQAEAYFAALQESDRKTIVDMDSLEKAQKKANAVLSNTKAMEHLTNQKGIKQDVRMEMELECEFYDEYPYGLKGIIDCVKIDYDNATIHITDLKTTSKSLDQWYEGFRDSEYMYWLQPIVYKELLLDLVPKDSKADWKLKVHYVVIDRDNQVYTFDVSAESLHAWQQDAKKAFDIAKWHMENHKFELPYKYEMGLVEL